ncbi:palmitoyltransferase akr1 [Puccinia graminis f. sp. tritici]|uniref:protein S-acyltransferase n=1 Tax=Puccinia graminis f. sp. tritici TaxID=56615 RepID=A0A5B0MZN6_PUCGR|nr:palmitoyltransferase akr1 [Puccinia graminis f. sp. tritici]
MSDQYLEQRKEEIEVLQSIFGDLSFESDDQVILRTGPKEPSPSNPLTVNLKIKYTEKYPDELPDIVIEPVEGELSELELESTVEMLKEAGRESLGTAMIFTLSLALQQALAQILSERAAEVVHLEKEEIKKAEEAEAARKKGTPINKEISPIRRAKFNEQNQLKKAKEEEERSKSLTPNERGERKKSGNKLMGRQPLESNQALTISTTTQATATFTQTTTGSTNATLPEPPSSTATEHTKTIREEFSFPEPPTEPPPSPLHLAAQRGDTEAVKQLLDSGLAHPTDVDQQQITALHWSAINGHLNLSALLIARGAVVDAFGGQLLATPLMWAARNGRVQIVHLLLKHGADPTLVDSQAFNTLHLATHSSSALTLCYLLACAYDKISLDSADREGHTALHWASYQGDSLSVDLLLSHRASVSARDLNGMTPLHWAVVKGNSTCIRQIVLAGADVLARTIEGKTPQEMAVELKSTFAWSRGLSEAGMNSNGTKRILPLGNGLKMKTIMFLFTIICFGLAFQTLSSLPYYSSIIISLAQAYGAHHIISNTILDANHRSPGRPSEIITSSPYFSTIIVASFFWVGYAWIAHLLPHTQDHPSLNLFFILSSLICVYNFVRAITLDPGYIPLPRNPLDRKTIIEGLVERSIFDGMNFCISCENRKPLRSKHCKICQRCIGKFDHHCPWVWNCVGVGNHRQFLVFVGTLIIGISLFDILAFIYFSSAPDLTKIDSRQLPASCSISQTLCQLAAFDSFTLSIVIWATLQLVWTTMLMVSQLWMVSRQMTTFELSNVNRFGFMGGKAGTSMAAQSSHLHAHHASAQSSLNHHHHNHNHSRKPKSFVFCLKLLGLDRFLDGTQIIKKSKKASNPFHKGIRANCLDFWTAGNHLGVNYLELFEVPEGGFQIRAKESSSFTSKFDPLHKKSSNGSRSRSSSSNGRTRNGYERVAMDIV